VIYPFVVTMFYLISIKISNIYAAALYIVTVIGEEVCDCYIDLRQSKQSRRKELENNFRFLCKCTACVRGESTGVGPIGNRDGNKNDEDKNEKEVEWRESTIGIVKDEPGSTGRKEEVVSEVVSEDDCDRVLASRFEDESIDMIIEDRHTHALETLYSGLKILEKKENLSWSVRYLSSAHLNIYQILMHLKDSSEDSGNGSGVRKGREKRSRKEIIRAEVNDSDTVVKIEKHLKLAHFYNFLLQGPLCPETVNTRNLLTQHGF
jgi:hypothetical protein